MFQKYITCALACLCESGKQDYTFMEVFLHVRLDREGGVLEAVHVLEHTCITCVSDVSAYTKYCIKLVMAYSVLQAGKLLAAMAQVTLIAC